MEHFTFIIFLLLCLGQVLWVFRKSAYARHVRVLRYAIVAGALIYFVVWFVQKSSYPDRGNAMSLQIINKLPSTLDFFVITVNDSGNIKNDLIRAGKIRPEHYQLEYLNMDHSREYWIGGLMGKDKLVYFSQHAVPDAGSDQIVEVNSYLMQSIKLADKAREQFQEKRLEDIGTAVWTVLSLILLFLNIVLLGKKH